MRSHRTRYAPHVPAVAAMVFCVVLAAVTVLPPAVSLTSPPAAAQTFGTPQNQPITQVVFRHRTETSPITVAEPPSASERRWILPSPALATHAPEYQGTCDPADAERGNYRCVEFRVELERVVRHLPPVFLGTDWTHYNYWNGRGGPALVRNYGAPNLRTDTLNRDRGRIEPDVANAPWYSFCEHHLSPYVNCYPLHSYPGHSWNGHGDSYTVAVYDYPVEIVTHRRITQIPGERFRMVAEPQLVCVAYCTPSERTVVLGDPELRIDIPDPAQSGGRLNPQELTVDAVVRCARPGSGLVDGPCGTSPESAFAAGPNATTEVDGTRSGEYGPVAVRVQMGETTVQRPPRYPANDVMTFSARHDVSPTTWYTPGPRAAKRVYTSDLGFGSPTAVGEKFAARTSGNISTRIATWSWVRCGLGNDTYANGADRCRDGSQLQIGSRELTLPGVVACRHLTNWVRSPDGTCPFAVINATARIN